MPSLLLYGFWIGDWKSRVLINRSDSQSYRVQTSDWHCWKKREFMSALWNRLKHIVRFDQGNQDEPTHSPFAVERHEARKLVLKANELCENGEYLEAIECLNRALDINPQYAEAWSIKGAALLSLERYPEAMASCDRALEIDRQLGLAWMNKGSSLSALERFGEARACFEEAQRLGDSRAAQAINSLEETRLFREGIELARLGREEEALICIERLLKINPDHAKALVFKAEGLRMQGRNIEAIVCCDRAFTLDPRTLKFIWRDKALALHALGRINEEVAWYDEVLKGKLSKEENATVWNGKGCAFLTSGRVAEAVPCLEEAQRLGHPGAAEAIAECRRFLKEG
jgi:tetratricopeptide (TPR) repeat protein